MLVRSGFQRKNIYALLCVSTGGYYFFMMFSIGWSR